MKIECHDMRVKKFFSSICWGLLADIETNLKVLLNFRIVCGLQLADLKHCFTQWFPQPFISLHPSSKTYTKLTFMFENQSVQRRSVFLFFFVQKQFLLLNCPNVMFNNLIQLFYHKHYRNDGFRILFGSLTKLTAWNGASFWAFLRITENTSFCLT